MAEDQSAVSCLSVSTVVPMRPTAKHKMFLSTFDLVCHSFPYINIIHFYNISSHHFPSFFHKLKLGLSSALVHFYPLAGRLVIDSSRPNSFQIDCNDAGVEFIHASANHSFPDLEADDFRPRAFFRKLVTMGNPYLSDNCDAPLVSIQVTEFDGGGVCVGCAASHVAVDGYSYLHFMKSWGESSRGLAISMIPFHDRTILKFDLNPSPATVAAGSDYGNTDRLIKPVRAHPKENPKHAKFPGNDSALRYEKFSFSRNAMENLKRLAEQNGTGRSSPFSSFVAFSSHFWRCMMKAKETTAEDDVYFLLIVDCRQRLDPPLPPNYFGNCLYMSLVGTTGGRLLGESGMWYGAHLITEAIDSCTVHNIKELINKVESNNYLLGDEYSEIFGRRLFMDMVGSPSFDCYQVDFGWGRPSSAQPALLDDCGSMFLLSGKEGKGSVEVWTALYPHHMQRFRSLL